MSKIRVMIVEDSATVREYLRHAICADARLTIVAECESAEHALDCLDREVPDVISMDIHLPRMNGLEAARRIMECWPTPIVIVSASVNQKEVDLTMEALRAGAVSVLEKPMLSDPNAAERICRELAVMSQVKVIRQRFNRPRSRWICPEPCSENFAQLPESANRLRASMIGIVASTGGPHALETVLTSIGPDCELPIVLVQHMTQSFHSGFISWLDRISPQSVVPATHGKSPLPGHVYVAPADKHLLVRRDHLVLSDEPRMTTQRPSGTILLQSMAESLGAQAVGVVLTGMGDDGAEGLRAIYRAGGCTIAEHQSTAIVNGMPEAARKLGAVRFSLPLDAIGTALKNLVPAMEEA